MTTRAPRRNPPRRAGSGMNISRPMPLSSQPTEKEKSQSSDLLPAPSPAQYTLRRDSSIPNTPFVASLLSASLGGVFLSSLSLSLLSLFLARGSASAGYHLLTPQLGIYLSAWSLFHLMEFWTTAVVNTGKLTVDAFLLNNGRSYHLAHAFGLAEYVVRGLISGSRARAGTVVGGRIKEGSFEHAVELARKLGGIAVQEAGMGSGRYASWLGAWWELKGWWSVALPLLILSQLLRSSAMIRAAASFSHIVSKKKREDHELVTGGVYAYFRHPSYAGFFYWAIATQLLLGNVVSTVAFALVLGRFFGDRIAHEEISLVEFFGQDYIDYRKKVGTRLPWFLVRSGGQDRFDGDFGRRCVARGEGARAGKRD